MAVGEAWCGWGRIAAVTRAGARCARRSETGGGVLRRGGYSGGRMTSGGEGWGLHVGGINWKRLTWRL